MKVLIAGGSGFMGRHLIKSLIADSHQVWVLSRNPNTKYHRCSSYSLGWTDNNWLGTTHGRNGCCRKSIGTHSA